VSYGRLDRLGRPPCAPHQVRDVDHECGTSRRLGFLHVALELRDIDRDRRAAARSSTQIHQHLTRVRLPARRAVLHDDAIAVGVDRELGQVLAFRELLAQRSHQPPDAPHRHARFEQTLGGLEHQQVLERELQPLMRAALRRHLSGELLSALGGVAAGMRLMIASA